MTDFRTGLLPLIIALLSPAVAAAGAPAVDFRRDVQPILARSCAECHGPKKQRSGLRVDSAAALRAGGDSGPAVVPGRTEESRLVQALTGANDVAAMPPKGARLTAEEVATIRAWVDQGANVPAEEAAKPDAKAAHWSFRPVQSPPVPVIPSPPSAVRNPIDAFILAKLAEWEIAPSP